MSKCENVCEVCGHDWPDLNYPGCINNKCTHDMSVNRKEFERRKEMKRKEELKEVIEKTASERSQTVSTVSAFDTVNNSFEKIAGEKKKKNVTVGAGMGALAGAGGAYLGGKNLPKKLRIALTAAGAGLGATANATADVISNRRLEKKQGEKVKSNSAKEEIKNIGKLYTSEAAASQLGALAGAAIAAKGGKVTIPRVAAGAGVGSLDGLGARKVVTDHVKKKRKK